MCFALCMANQIMRYFSYEHLPNGLLKDISKEICTIAHDMERILPDSAEKTAGLRKLLEAKDCFVRSGLDVS